MGSRRAALRTDLSHILGGDETGSGGQIPEPSPPSESVSNRLHALISRGLEVGSDDARTIYEYLPLIMLRVFGYHPGSGWLETAAELPYRDRVALMRLVLPDGPVYAFCAAHEPQVVPDGDGGKDFRYEFPVRNLPAVTQRSLRNPSLPATGPLHTQSALAPFLRSAVSTADPSMLLLSAAQYVTLCMVASAANKWTPNTGVPPTGRKAKRSVSLPSVRALYNTVISEHAARVDPLELLGASSLLVPACVDFYCLPWTEAHSISTAPTASAQAVDALTSVTMGLLPRTTAHTALPPALSTHASGGWKALRSAEALFAAQERMHEAVFNHYSAPFPVSVLSAYVRLFALFVAPWHKPVKMATHALLFPKPRGASKRASLSTLNASWASISARLPLSPVNALSPSRAANGQSPVSPSGERQWREKLLAPNERKDLYLVLLTIICAANCRLGSSSDGCRALALLAEAAEAARVRTDDSDAYGLATVRLRSEEAKGCLLALREQMVETEKRLNAKMKPFAGSLGTRIGVQVENLGIFSGVGGMIPGSSNHSPTTPGGVTRRHLHERRSSIMGNSSHEGVPFLGTVWERPIAQGENEKLVIMAYWLSLQLAPWLGYTPNTRVLGQYWVWASVLVIGGVLFLISVMLDAATSV